MKRIQSSGHFRQILDGLGIEQVGSSDELLAELAAIVLEQRAQIASLRRRLGAAPGEVTADLPKPAPRLRLLQRLVGR